MSYQQRISVKQTEIIKKSWTEILELKSIIIENIIWVVEDRSVEIIQQFKEQKVKGMKKDGLQRLLEGDLEKREEEAGRIFKEIMVVAF